MNDRMVMFNSRSMDINGFTSSMQEAGMRASAANSGGLKTTGLGLENNSSFDLA